MKSSLLFTKVIICWIIALGPCKAQNSSESESIEQIKLADPYVLLEKQNKKGLATPSGQILIPVEYDEIGMGNPYIFLRKLN